jgi:hypothetical protein
MNDELRMIIMDIILESMAEKKLMLGSDEIEFLSDDIAAALPEIFDLKRKRRTR